MTTPQNGVAAPIVLQMKSASKSKIKRLVEGHGSLMEKINLSIEDLKAQGVIAEHAQPVIVVVKQKRKRKNPLRLFS